MDSARQAAHEYLNQHHLGTGELWLHYWSNGGQTGCSDFSAYLDQVQNPAEGEQQVLIWALQDLVAKDAQWQARPPTAAGSKSGPQP
jgi:hypothetical protein